MKIKSDKRQEWVRFHQERALKNYPKWPNEAMLKVLFGKYLLCPFEFGPGAKVLDIGCGFGNNLLPFLDMGCECYGVEIDPEITLITASILSDRGFSADIRKGENRSLPFESGTFDLVLSINTLHYESTEERILDSLREVRRILRPGGAFYLSTVGPEHEIYKKSEPLGGHRYRIRDFDFRDGQIFFFFDNTRYLEYYLKQVFDHVETGHVTERLMTFAVDFLIAVCR